MLLWRLILALFISDFILQFNWIIRIKEKPLGLALHGLIYIVVSLLAVINILNSQLVILIIALGLLHILVDTVKNLLKKCVKGLDWFWFLADQSVHVLTVIIGVGLVSDTFRQSFITQWNQIDFLRIIKYASLGIINLMGGMFFTESITKNYQSEEKASRINSHAVIGIFERLLITISVIIAKFEIIGFLIAAKSLIRLPEAISNDPGNKKEASHKMVNYYLIGTFVSYSWAITITLLFKRFVL
jgi:hypothetical protein